jgi:hypothetical protein
MTIGPHKGMKVQDIKKTIQKELVASVSETQSVGREKFDILLKQLAAIVFQ